MIFVLIAMFLGSVVLGVLILHNKSDKIEMEAVRTEDTLVLEPQIENFQSQKTQIEEPVQSEVDRTKEILRTFWSHEEKVALNKYKTLSRKTYLEPAPINQKEVKSCIDELYALYNLEPPLIIRTQSPLACVHATLILEGLSERRNDPTRLSKIIRNWDSITDECIGDKKIWRDAWGALIDSQWLTDKPAIGEFLCSREREKHTARNWKKLGGDVDFFDFQNKYFALNGMVNNTAWTSPALIYRTITDYVSRADLKLSKSELWSLGHSSNSSYHDRHKEICYGNLNNYQDYFGLFIFEYFLEEAQNKTPKNFEIEYLNLYKSVGWVLPFENICLVTEPHNDIHIDDHHLLHNEEGPAVTYPDGSEIYIWRGRDIPKRWIIDGPTVQETLTWRDIEQRSIACEILGWNNILKEVDTITLDKDEDPKIGELLSVELPDIGREKFLRVTCGTGRKFILPVPPEMTTALEANAWTWGLEPHQYKPEVRT